MLTKYFQTCICCEDPIAVSGFLLHVCEECRRDMGDTAPPEQQIIACRLYQFAPGDNSSSLDVH